MKTFRSMSLPLFALVAALAGCSAEAGTSASAEPVADVHSGVSAVQADKLEGRRPESHAHRAHGGPALLVHAALRAPINLTAEQKATIEGLVNANAHAAPSFDAGRASKLAAAIRSNSVAAAPEPAVDETARTARIAASAATLKTLHDTLTAEQRIALVDSITKRAAERTAKLGEHGAKRGEKHGERGPRAGEEMGERGPMRLLAGLDLTQAQKDTIKAKLDAERPAKPSAEERDAMKARFEAARAGMQAKLESFKGDTFDATAFVTPSKEFARSAKRGDRRMNELAIVTSVLEPAQREALAARIEQGPARFAAEKTPKNAL